jgi:ferredoxin/flavodoxin---NADP+ reductase
MAYAITQSCCADASCVSVCPVNCIHPTPDEPDFGSTDLLYVDPRACIDCGACADACPVDAAVPIDLLSPAQAEYADVNASYYRNRPPATWSRPRFPEALPDDVPPPRVAIVGTGPAAVYTARSLLRTAGAEITMLERLPVPGGLLRYGVAPDHTATRQAVDLLTALRHHPRVRLFTNVTVGTDIGHADLLAHHDAVVYAVGAESDQPLGLPGEDLSGVLSAARLVRWYNAHPGVPATAVDLTAERVVVIGNGNVAVDIGRVLLTDPDRLSGTDIAAHALAAIRSGRVREVVLLGRRGPEHAAYTRPELQALRHLPGVRVVVAEEPGVRAAIDAADGKAALLRGLPVEPVDWSAPPPGRRIVLRFHATPTAFDGTDRVAAVLASGTRITAGLVVRSTGHRGTRITAVPFDETTGTVPNDAGRVTAGCYVVGWIKRGSTGGIGSNRDCAEETVRALLDDAAHRRLPRPTGTAKDFARLVRRREPIAARSSTVDSLPRVG